MILFSQQQNIITELGSNQLVQQSDYKENNHYISLRDETGTSTIRLARYNTEHRALEVMSEIYTALKQNKSFYEFPYN